MLDLSHIPNSQQDVRIFYANGSAWQTWNKPRKCSYVWIMCIGGAGGGGGGFSVSNTPYSTGGGSGGVSRALYNAQQLPDTLYVQVGLGGAGGGTGIAGSPGTRSWVSLQQQAGAIVAQNIVQGSGGTAAAGGTAGAGTSAAGEIAMAQTSGNFLALSNFIATGGVTAAGSAVVTPPDITPFSSQIVTQGAGGGNWDVPSAADPRNGASILSSSISPLIQGGARATASGSSGGNGADGITSWKPFFSTGGAGGGAAISGSGGNGGNGGIGSGGGAGGGSNQALGYTGGRGGRGGDGLVVIISF